MKKDIVDNYNKITQLSAIQHIQLRPGMYIGDNTNPQHLFSEVIDNSLDEATNGYCNEIRVTYKDNILSVKDNGRGIPHGLTDKGQESLIASTESMSGGKFDNLAYSKARIGLHGVGLCAVRALTEYMIISSVRNKEEHKARFEYSELKSFDKSKSSDIGTYVEFKPDPKYFEDKDIPDSYIKER